MEFLKVATILSTIGLKGELRVYTNSNLKELRYYKNSELYIDNGNEPIKVHLESFRNKEGNIDILKFKEINSIEEASSLIQKEILVIKDNSILENDEYFYTDLVGLACYDENNTFLGTVKEVIDYTNIVNLIVEKEDQKTVNIPFNDFFVLDIDLINKKILIHTIEGLF